MSFERLHNRLSSSDLAATKIEDILGNEKQ